MNRALLFPVTTAGKLEPLVRVVTEQVGRKPGSKVIVFAELRDTVDFLADLLREEGIQVERFTGQGTPQGRKGMTQKQQRESLARFADGAFPVLCATSIAEEGLEVPQVDLVVFYEPVASDVRLIQRKGRTGRDAPGKVVILTTNRTADERYLRAGLKRERQMKRLVRRLSLEPVRPMASQEVKPLESPAPRQVPIQAVLTDYATEAHDDAKPMGDGASG